MTEHDGAAGARPRRELPDRAFRRMLETLSIPVMLVDGDGTIVWVGGSAERDFGRSPRDVAGRNVIEFIPPEQVEEAIHTMGDLMQHQDLGIGVPPVYAVVRSDGSWTWQAVAAVPLTDDPDVGGFTFYYLPWDATYHFDDALAALLAGEPLEDVFAHLTRSIALSLEAVGASVHHGFDGERFAEQTGHGVPAECLQIDDGPWHAAARAGERQYVTIDRLAGRARDAAAAAGIGACWSIPIPGDPSVKPAVLSIWRAAPTPPVTAHEFVITRALRHVQLVLVRHAEHAQLAHMANHDVLTGTVNRAVFNDSLAAAVQGTAPAAVLFCDLDGFKQVNDTLGHIAGDAVLVEVAGRLRDAMRPGDILARMGGDEFTVLLRGDETVARAVAERVLAAMAPPVVVGDGSVSLGVSVGAAISGPADTPSSLLRRADDALYTAKRSGGGRIQIAPAPASD